MEVSDSQTHICIACKSEIEKTKNLYRSIIKIERLLLTLEAETGQSSSTKPLLDQCCTTCLESMTQDMVQEVAAVTARKTQIQTQTQSQPQFTIVDSSTEEYERVTARFHETVKNKIIRIERNDNPDLYHAYQETCKRLKVGEEQLLFHGSKNENYVKITTGGFDKNKSADGALGYGVYFAEDASYSTGFAQHLTLKETNKTVSSMLLCKVRFSGDTGRGHRIYCVRNDRQCYPAWIIYYTT